jgi:hypothetical protein
LDGTDILHINRKAKEYSVLLQDFALETVEIEVQIYQKRKKVIELFLD